MTTPTSATGATTGFKALDDLLRNAGAARFGNTDLSVSLSSGAGSGPGGGKPDAAAGRFINQTVNDFADSSRNDAEQCFFGGFKPQQGGGTTDIRISIGLMPPTRPYCPPPPAPPPQPSNPTHAGTTMQNGRAVFENDNYIISAGHDTTVNITNKKTGATYQASGDPHMSVNGNHAFDFWGTTSLALDDGTKVTFGTTDAGNGMNETAKLTITSGDYGAEIKGIDNKADSCPLSLQEYAGQGQALDGAVDDGVTLQENAAGNDLVTTDQNGHEFHVDQNYIDSVDEFKTQGRQSENTDQFDDVGSDAQQMAFGSAGGDAEWAFLNAGGFGGGGSADPGYGNGLDASGLGGSSGASFGSDSTDWLKQLEAVIESQQSAEAAPPPPPARPQQHHAHASQYAANHIRIGLNVPGGFDSRIAMAFNGSRDSAQHINLRLWG